MFENIFSSENMIMYFARIFMIIFILPVHELAHGYAALKLGDDTAKQQGRITLNPISHIHPIGSLMLLLVGFGFAKPVPVNPARFNRNISMKNGMAITAAAGPLSNLILAFLFLIIFKILSIFTFSFGNFPVGSLFNVYDILTYQGFLAEVASNEMLFYAMMIVGWIVLINIMLAVFNMLPVPPLDGSRIAALFLPQNIYFNIMRYEQYIMIGLFAVIAFTSVLSQLIGTISKGVYFALDKATIFVDLLAGAV
ncbi:MAG: site-2 protease family protein [Oscillospiraceae bacterium]|nr:site-2 protease family protein [Oscillospiraceae bacterium]